MTPQAMRPRRRVKQVADNFTQATLTPPVRLTDELVVVLEITGASLQACADGTWYAYWEDGIIEPDEEDADAWDLPETWAAAEAAAFRHKWGTQGPHDILRAILAVNPDIELLTLEGAHTCSKMRPGEFGGFGLYVTRRQFASIITGDVILREDVWLAITTEVQEWNDKEGGE